uniref:ShKT domain-containing protein n=1 Tax=Acrobeloides nanus TaxID=290746 RepID=A0A914D235_9BILA
MGYQSKSRTSYNFTAKTSGYSRATECTNRLTPYQCMDLGCLCSYMGGNGQTGSNACTLRNGQPLNKARRKEYRILTDDERQRFHAAVLAIKRSGEYDNLARIHSQFAESGGAHSGPSFLPWHREFVKRYEIALRMVDPTVAVPYWDSTLDGALPTPLDSIMFTEAFMGQNDASGNLNNGPFARWQTIQGRPNIERRMGAQGTLLTEADIQYIANAPDITRVLAYTAPNQGCQVQTDFKVLEYTHGNVHIWVGGDMIEQTTSANDPIFWLLHSFVDFIWEMYRQNPYMAPFQPWRNNDGLNNKYTDNMFEFEPRPTCPACGGSQYLFCDISHGQPRCASKIRAGGNCQGFFSGENACYNGQCVNGRCVGGPPPTTARPPPVTTLATPVQQNCFNEHECCATWNQKGECARNPTYMGQWCKASCGKCQPSYALAECNDRHPKCAEWSAKGECTRNILWMAENCRQSCNKCGRSRQQICGGGGGGSQQPQQTTPRPANCNPVGCFNENICCQFWGLQGQCARNITFMSCNCRVTCGLCQPRDYQYGTCFDYHPSCQKWAFSGECQKNPWMLENCKDSCDSCYGWRELRQLCRGGGQTGRGKRSELQGFAQFDIDQIGEGRGMPSMDLND